MKPVAAVDRLLTVTEVAQMLRVSPSTAKKWAAEGKLPGTLPKIGGLWRIHEATFLAYIRGGTPARSTNAAKKV